MGYPEDHLAPEEKLIINARPHWKQLIGHGLLFVIGTVLAIVLYSWLEGSSNGGTMHTVLTWLIVLGWLVVAVLWGR